MNWFDDERNVLRLHHEAQRKGLEHYKVVKTSRSANVQIVRRAVNGFGARLVQWGLWMQRSTTAIPPTPAFPDNNVNGRPC